MKDTIDKDALYRVMSRSFEMHQVEKPKWSEMLHPRNWSNIKGMIASAKTLAKEGRQYMKEVVVSSSHAEELNEIYTAFEVKIPNLDITYCYLLVGEIL